MFFNGHLHNYGKLTLSITLAACTLITAGAVPARAQFGLALTPMREEFTVSPGGQRNGTLIISNDDHIQSARFRTEILDVSIDKEATPQFIKDIPSEADYSCRQWVTVNPIEATMLPGGQMPIRYTFRVPAGISARTYHCALAFTSLADAAKPQSRVGIVAQLRLAATFYLTVGNPVPLGVIQQIAMERVNAPETSGYRVLTSVENFGETNLRGVGTVELLDESGKPAQTMDFPQIAIYPRRVQRIPLVIPGVMPDGAYTLRIRVNLGTGEIQEALYRFRVPLPAR